MSDTTSNIILDPATKSFPDGPMGSLRSELGLMAGFIGAFMLAFAIWCILFKYFSDREDKQRMELMARGIEMQSGVRHRGGVVGPMGMAVQDEEITAQKIEDCESNSKDD